MAPDGINSRLDFSDRDLFAANGLHEGGHMAGVLAVGLAPIHMKVVRDRPAFSGDISYIITPVRAQYLAVISELGSVAEERAYNELGYTEQSHPELFHEIRVVGSTGDKIQMARLQQQNPHVILDLERAAADARRMVANPVFWKLTSALGREVDRLGYLDDKRVLAVAAPFDPATLLDRENLHPWMPSAEQVRRAREAAGLAPGQAPPPPKELAPDPVGDRVRETARRALAAARDKAPAVPQDGRSAARPPGVVDLVKAAGSGAAAPRARPRAPQARPDARPTSRGTG